jgi:hypothetical protein
MKKRQPVECLRSQHIAKSFHIDGHGPAVVRSGRAGGRYAHASSADTQRREASRASRNVHVFKRNVHDGGDSRIEETSVISHSNLLSGY